MEEEDEDLSSSSSLLKNDEKRANADDLTIVVVPPLTTTTLFFFFFCVIVGTTLDFASFEEDGSVARIMRVVYFMCLSRARCFAFCVEESRLFPIKIVQIERE
jgi:hypothetical protein